MNMKRILALGLLCALMAGVCACARTAEPAPEPTATPEPTIDPAAEVAASATDAAANAQSHTPPASSTDTVSADDTLAAAEACVGLAVEELYAAVGQPAEEPQYAPSCLQDGAEDGMLYYDGFYVWTVRTETEEIVHAVYPDGDEFAEEAPAA